MKEVNSRTSAFLERKESSSLPINISIITITYNRLDGLVETFESVVNQTHKEYEYIIVDGGSDDGTVDFLEENSCSISKWVSEPDEGIYDAMNKGISLASGEWLIFMNAGDFFFCDRTLQELELYLDSSYDVLFGGVESIYDDQYGYRTSTSLPHDISLLWQQIPTCHQSIVVRRDIQTKYLFNTSFNWCADHDFLAKLYSDSCKMKSVSLIISRFEASGDRQRDLLTYTKERWTIYRRYFEHMLSRDLFFINEYRSFWLQKNVNQKIREWLPANWIVLSRKLRGIG